MKKHTVLLMLTCFIVVTLFSCSDSNSNAGNNSNGTSSQTTSQAQEEKKTEWTQWLDRYESLVEKNNALQARVQSGDMSAAQEVVSLSQEMVEVSQKCQENQSSMSSAEVKRMMEIMHKIKY